MILIADSGSTKTHWALIAPGGDVREFFSPGINPALCSPGEFKAALADALKGVSLPADCVIEYYGAGCLPELCPVVEAILAEVTGCSHVAVHSDMLGAARSVCGPSPGIVAILGTGSNSCYYDGSRILLNTPPLGYVLGDEGSGARLGARLLNGVLKGWLSPHIVEAFHSATGLDKAAVIEHVYRRPEANRFLASMVPFIADHIAEPEVAAMVTDEFTLFLERNVVHAYPQQLPLHTVGSVGAVFAPQLRQAAVACSITVGNVVQRPMSGLISFHSNRN
ncbi:MAG: ATPase [Firmicutes bacterium]|nr:ATPase [Bacillota bacterium]MCM1401351.1 ATPase [Bacteroides sp.]MCM1477376.1 ATPase [Bacteroides sp.]